jgi:tetratricopeptide (TPR) repeat protein
MPAPQGARAVELLLDEAWAATGEGRYGPAVAAAQRAVQAAEALDDPALLARALVREASPLRMLGDDAAALARCTRVLTLANDPAIADRLGGEPAAWAVAQAYIFWVACARFLTGIGTRELFGVLDAAQRWLTATGRRDWRAGVLLERAIVHWWLGELDAAVAAAQEALAAYDPRAPGYTLATHRFQLGDILREAGRHGEARPHYQAILDDPDANSHDRKAAHQGLAWCAVAGGDPEAGRRHAAAAVRLAEPLGDDALCPALAALVAACRAGGDLDGAWRAATRGMEAAGRVGGHYRPYYATRDALDVALDRGDADTARRLLADLDAHAAALDTTTGTDTRARETARRRSRLAQLEAGVGTP